MEYNFTGKTVLVLAGSKGIGFEISNQFYQYNADVIIVSRSLENLKKAKKEILKNKLTKGSISIEKFDISNVSKIDTFAKQIEKKYSKSVDILISNSGGPPPKSISQITNKDWQNALNNNLLGAIYFTKVFSKKMIKNNWGRIIYLTSSTAKEPVANFALSNVPRAALSSFSKTLSLEIADKGVTVNNILTGGVLTERLKYLVMKNIKNKSTSYNKEIKNISKTVPVGHVATPEEFIQIIFFLASEKSSYVNGLSIPVDGGTSKSLF